jgi:hypothetical protein
MLAALSAGVKQRATGQLRLPAMIALAQSDFQRPSMPLAVAEQVSTQGPVAQIKKLAARPLQAGQGNNGARQNPGLAVAPQAHFANPRVLARGNIQLAGFLGAGPGKTLPGNFYLKTLLTALLQSPGE